MRRGPQGNEAAASGRNADPAASLRLEYVRKADQSGKLQNEKPDCKSLSLWKFKFDFDCHWGDHCINALAAVHYFLQIDAE